MGCLLPSLEQWLSRHVALETEAIQDLYLLSFRELSEMRQVLAEELMCLTFYCYGPLVYQHFVIINT